MSPSVPPAGKSEEPDTIIWIREAFTKYEGPLLRYTFRYTSNLEHARDIVQEAFIKLCAQPRGKVEPHLQAWLFTVCRNAAMDMLRKEKRLQPLTDMDLEQTSSDTAADPARAAIGQEVKSRLLSLLGKLPPNQQEVVRLKFQEGLSYKEISEVTGLSVSNVGFLIHTGVSRLRQQFASEKEGAAS
jgi:RNA polymerase sigma factor (sigma-70 family)